MTTDRCVFSLAIRTQRANSHPYRIDHPLVHGLLDTTVQREICISHEGPDSSSLPLDWQRMFTL